MSMLFVLKMPYQNLSLPLKGIGVQTKSIYRYTQEIAAVRR